MPGGRGTDITQPDFPEELVRHRPALERSARRLCRNRHDAEDLVQATLVRAWQARAQFSPGGNIGGWTLYAKGGKLKYCYNLLGIQHFFVESEGTIPAGDRQVRMEFAYDGGGLAKGGDVTLCYDGSPVGAGRVEATQPMIFSAGETTDIGYESGTTVTPDYDAHGSRFTGTINWVQIDLGADDHDHFIDPDERLRIVMARQ